MRPFRRCSLLLPVREMENGNEMRVYCAAKDVSVGLLDTGGRRRENDGGLRITHRPQFHSPALSCLWVRGIGIEGAP